MSSLSALKVGKIVVAQKATVGRNVDRVLAPMKARVNRNVNSHCRQDFWQLQKTTLSTPIVDGKHSFFQVLGSSESYGNVSS